MNKISIIVPCYNEEKSLPLFYQELMKNINLFENVDFEFVFVNDGSQDSTLTYLKDLAKEDLRVKYISFSRNFGKESAIFAGLENATGDFITIMDADLQDPPSLLLEMYKSVTEEDFDAVRNTPCQSQRRTYYSQFFCQTFLQNHQQNVQN